MFVTYEHVQGTQLPMRTEEENGDKREWNTVLTKTSLNTCTTITD